MNKMPLRKFVGFWLLLQSCLDFNISFVLQTDASSLGAVLAQNIDSIENIIAFASCALSDTEKKIPLQSRNV